MNLCVISEYTCTFDDFEKMVEENKNEEVITDHLLTKVNDHKSVLLLNCVDMEAFQALLQTDGPRLVQRCLYIMQGPNR